MAIRDGTSRGSIPKRDRKPIFYGYARVSTLDQDLTLQRAVLKAAGTALP